MRIPALPGALLALPLTILSPGAVASCFGDLQGGDAPYAAQIATQTRQAITSLQAALSSAAPPNAGTASQVPVPNAELRHSNPPSRAKLFAMLVDAYENTGELDQAQTAAAAGLAALTASDGEALRHRLELRRIALRADRGQITRALQDYEAAAASVPETAPYFVCMLIDRGYLRYRNGRIGDAAEDLMRAQRRAAEMRNDRLRIDAGNVLSMVYSRAGFHDDARALASETLHYYENSSDAAALAGAYFIRGDVELQEGNYAAAEPDLTLARDVSEQAGQPVDTMYARQRLCQALVKLHRAPQAQITCADAYSRAVALQDSESAKLVLASQAELAAAAGRNTAAAALFDRALAQDGFEIAPRMQAEIHRERGEVRAQLGDAVAALADNKFYIDWLEADRVASRADQLAVLQVKFATELKDRELQAVRATARKAEAEAARDSVVSDLVLVLSVLVILAVVLASWLWRRRKETEDARRAAEERLAAVGRLTGGIAHDFNNFLTVMKQTLGLLQRLESVSTNSTAVALLEEIRVSEQGCANITAQMLSFARQQNLKPEAVPLDHYLAEVRSMIERSLGERRTLLCQIGRPAPVAWVDRRQLTAALLNLVSNARDAMAADGRLTITACAEAGKQVRVDVIDNGSGMNKQVLEHAIEPFFSTKQVGSGSGLGLSMVEGFVVQSGGRMTLVSEPQQGTMVSFWLPAAAAATRPS